MREIFSYINIMDDKHGKGHNTGLSADNILKRFYLFFQIAVILFILICGVLFLLDVPPFDFSEDYDDLRLLLGGTMLLYGIIRLGLIVKSYRK